MFSSIYLLPAANGLEVWALSEKIFIKCNVRVGLSGRALRQQRKRLWVRFPGNTHTNENV